ncbi:TetR/AcrR family transcriptional regulator [Yersinia massiliensis]|jgi:TetR/AcrR family transcriptional repressor of nem operon|uniref:TetR/AcrR family transcriptional regulator n=2 Tax=Yersinia TaxID=629 RepID=A0A2R4NQC7_9GAMM|nr:MULTISPECIES: TetR/AcrR family transcriptional regulator [Yersinia]HEC1650181.1 TetR/AcrR family transcriptional regulator [Yersinia enterocolitica]ATM85769.1 TetR/AcrR family transcriptional regulator [Yersinia frederiksenii]AVX38296.1 TetR/AcrR family transcriptional regulator [Yersinia massiliensis]MCB5316608.1 TetR/AcrR family transcriptional regulator [Yersinia massiliensis]MDA5547871.1 TetR/AcrR family transcriptional regulator [Yersinia massiliensis]
MNKIQHPHVDTREHLLATGESLSLHLGFNGMGLSQLLTTAGIPKGSFYHYFRSKEAFGEAMLQRYFDRYDAAMVNLLTGSQGDKRHQLLQYFAQSIANYCGSECHNACLSVKLSAEVSDLSEPMRHALDAGTARVIGRLQDAIEAGIKEGSLRITLSAAATAETLYTLWQGAALRAKVKRSVTPLTCALESIELMLQPTQ